MVNLRFFPLVINPDSFPVLANDGFQFLFELFLRLRDVFPINPILPLARYICGLPSLPGFDEKDTRGYSELCVPVFLIPTNLHRGEMFRSRHWI